MAESNKSTDHFIHPKYAHLWLGIGMLWAIARLPYGLQLRIGKFLGWLGYQLAGRRRHIAETNIKMCFPELSTMEQQALIKRIFRSIGINLIETAIAWSCDPKFLKLAHKISGIEHLEKAQSAGRGVVLLGAHFSTLDLAGAFLSLHTDIDIMYRRHKNPFFETIMKNQREKLFGTAIDRKDMRQLIRALKKGRIIWYAADQDYGRKHSVFAPFFNIPTATISATARLAGIRQSPVLFFSHFRNDTTGVYELMISKPVENFPSGNALADASRVNQIIEAAIRTHPDQYLWLHRRFKTRPEGMDNVY